MALIKVADTIIKHAYELLTKQKEQLNEMLSKQAAIQQENTAYRDVLELVTSGVIDPADAFHKYEEFKQDPSLPNLLKKARDLGFLEEHQKLGETVGRPGPSENASPEDRFLNRLQALNDNE